MTRHDAPGSLELVRELLNTWVMPNEPPRTPVDHLPALAADPERWNRVFGPVPSASKIKVITRLRDDLHRAAGRQVPLAQALEPWLAEFPVAATIAPAPEAVVHLAAPGSGLVGEVLVAVVDAVAAGQWSRLKLCRDCEWAFYDWTGNAGRVWCGMYRDGPGSRACGTIAKVRRHRAAVSE